MKFYTLTGMILLWFMSTMNAQNTGDTSAIRLKEVVISVNKTEELKSNVAQQVEVITAEESELYQNQTTADLVSNSSSVFLQKSQMGGGSPVLRGFEANRVLLVIDGVRMNNLIYRGGHLQNIITMDESMIDRVEILFGPSSTVYGSDALGGVLHFYSRKPKFSTGEKLHSNANAALRWSSVDNEFNAHADVNLGGRRFASLTSFSRSDFGDLRGGDNQNPFYNKVYGTRPFYVERINGRDSLVNNQDRFRQVQSGYTQYDIIQKFSFRPVASITHDLNVQYSTSNDIPRYDRLTDPSGSGLRWAEWYYGPQERLMAAYDFTWLPTDWFFNRVHAGVNYQKLEESRHTRRFGNDNLQHRIENVNVIGFNAEAEENTETYDLRVGIDGQYNTLKSTASVENIVTGASSKLDTRYPGGDNNLMNVSAFVSLGWNISKKLRLTDGARIGYSRLYSQFTDTTFFPFPFSTVEQKALLYSGTIGLIHKGTDQTQLSVLVSSGYRVPNVDDLAKVFESAAGNLIVPNPDLKPEKTITYEIGLSTKDAGKRFELNTYYTDFFDAIVTDAFRYDGRDSILYNGQMSRVVANKNMRRAFITGFTVIYAFNQDKKLKGEISGTYTYGRIKTDTIDYPLDHIPPFNARLQFSYTVEKFSSIFFVQFNGWKRLKDYNIFGEDNQNYATADGMPAWFTLNWKNRVRINDRISAMAGVENILDIQYRTFSSGINGPGRNFYIGLKVSY